MWFKLPLGGSMREACPSREAEYTPTTEGSDVLGWFFDPIPPRAPNAAKWKAVLSKQP